ncbi:MAG: ATPase [Lachnospiraceae bacterium]|nr:ATPase [Lachnospiraceae bacterium]
MNPSRIEQAIDDIYNYVESCKPSKLYPSKVVVERGELYDLLDELRLCAPEEIKRYQKIITNREGILNEAQQQAEDMLSQAKQQTAQILDQNEIVQTAYQRAEEIMKQATEEAQRLVNAAQAESDQMHRAALLYTNDLLTEAKKNVEASLKETDNKYRMLNSALKNSIQVMQNNQEELMSQLEPEKYARKAKEASEEAAGEASAAEDKTASGESGESQAPEGVL